MRRCLLVDGRDMHAALREALLDHRVDVHEGLDGDALDALAEELAQSLVLTGQRRGGELRERADAEVAARADVLPQGTDRRVRQRRLLAEQVEQRLLDRVLELLVDAAVGDPVRDQVGVQIEELLEPVVPDELGERVPGSGVVLEQVADRTAVRVAAGQCGEILPGDLAVRLRRQSCQHAGVREAVVRVDARRPAGSEHGLDRDAAHVGRLHGPADHRADLAVVDAQGRGHREGREHACLAETSERALLEPADVRAAVVRRRLGALAVVLQVHLHPLAVLLERRDERVVLCDAQAVRVQQDAHHGARNEVLQQLLEPRVQGRLAAGEHEHVDAVVLPRQPRVDRGENLGKRGDRARRRAGLREARGTAQVAVVGEVLQQDAGVLRLHLGKSVLVGRGHRLEVAREVGLVHLGRRGPLLEVGEDLGRLVVHRALQPVLRASALQPDPIVPHGQPAAQAADIGERPIRILLVARRAERVDVAMHAVVAQGLAGSGGLRAGGGSRRTGA